MAKKQEIFDKVATHLFTQRKRAFASGHGCRYRTTAKGQVLKCAVGCLIPDEAYDRSLENTPAHMLPAETMQAIGIVRTDYIRFFLTDLQAVHDSAGSWRSPQAMRGALMVLAKQHQLKTDVLTPELVGDVW